MILIEVCTLCTHLFIILITILVDNVVETKLIGTLADRNDTEPVTELILLQVLLCPMPEVRYVSMQRIKRLTSI